MKKRARSSGWSVRAELEGLGDINSLIQYIWGLGFGLSPVTKQDQNSGGELVPLGSCYGKHRHRGMASLTPTTTYRLPFSTTFNPDQLFAKEHHNCTALCNKSRNPTIH